MPIVSQDIGRIVMKYSHRGPFREAMHAGIVSAETVAASLGKGEG